MSNQLLDLSSKDELISSLLTGNKPSVPKGTPVGERKTFKVDKSDLLSRLEDFLPKIKEANVQLDQQLKADPKAVDIENVDEENGEQYIEMDLGLGVFDLKKDVKEEDIIINPSELKKAAEASAPATKKPTIVMMDMNKDQDHMDEDSTEINQEASEGSHKENKNKIPAHSSSSDEDVVMSS
ncbi:hypothetical protein EC957_010192 [Mortierella hygrophila]|uniref:Uncharacterized protein n=1 Tax=Mortierella hygrophila TaxID=979708 RepID=A0A9P6FB37_9FUNG|nr:hypothetical protein EC957_010192 [Mortierella hygrophila]